MADLEDFFAKRDKKKKKAPKFEADNVAKILEKKRVDMGKSSYQPSPSESTEPISEYKAQEDDDEWREAVEQKPDYSGLKIQDLVLEDNEEEEKEGAIEEESQKEGPWKPRTMKPETAVVVDTPKAAPTPVVEKAPVVPEPEPEKAESIEDDDRKSEKSTGSGSETGRDKGPEAAEAPKKYMPPAVKKAMEAQAAAAALRASQTPTPTPARVSQPPATAPTPAGGDAKPATVAPAGKYVPPVRRGIDSSSTGAAGATRPRKPVVAPRMNDQKMFPSLGS